MDSSKERLMCPLWEKTLLSVDEASVFSGIGTNKIYELTNDAKCPFVLWVGTKRLIKRKKFSDFLESNFSI